MFCYQKNFSNPTLPVDEAQFWALVRATQWNENIDKYRETHDAALKRKLPAFIFQATFDETTSKAGKTGAWRKQAATRLTGLVVMDIDGLPRPLQKEGSLMHLTPLEIFQRWREEHPELFADAKHPLSLEGDGGRLLLVYITPSGKGLKVVFMKTRNLLRNMMLSIGLVILVLLRLLLWPTRVMNKGLLKAGKWLMSLYR